MNGDFTNRTVDPYLIESSILKYKVDILSINLGISDGIIASFDGGIQTTLTNKEQFQSNFKKLINAAKKANPNVVIIVNDINPNNYVTSDQNRKIIPNIYNPYLEKFFNPSNNQYSDYVIYNPKSYSVLNKIFIQYPYLTHDKLFFGEDYWH